jgi:diphosphomevalonate decarboxylase
MRATAIAQPNIALIKYWGKRDTSRNLPAVGSISITLDELFTRMQVQLDAGFSEDMLTVNGEPAAKMLPRIGQCLDRVLGHDRNRARIESTCNFPIAAGLASSASAFAAAVVAAAAAGGRNLQTSELASLAGAASGSAARSLYGGFVELRNAGDDIEVSTLRNASDWPLRVVVAITTEESKPVSSGEAMELSRKTSPFYENWVNNQDADLDVARRAIKARDFPMLAAVAEHNCLKMHSVMWASRPAIVYWNSATLNCLQTVRELQADGVDVFFTIDAGPQVKAVCLPEQESDVRAALTQTDGVTATMVSGLGQGARMDRQQ